MLINERKVLNADIAKELARAKRLALREITKVETEITDVLGAVERYYKRHPKQAAAVTLSLGAALGAAGALYWRGKGRKR